MSGKVLLVLVSIAVIVAASSVIILQTMKKGTEKEGQAVISPTVTEQPVGREQSETTESSLESQRISAANQIILDIISPVNGVTVATPTITVIGKTVPNAEVVVNDIEKTADANGNFSVSITLDEDENIIIVVANDTNGNVAEREITVTYTPSQ